jgi:hypothetical protein
MFRLGQAIIRYIYIIYTLPDDGLVEPKHVVIGTTLEQTVLCANKYIQLCVRRCVLLL